MMLMQSPLVTARSFLRPLVVTVTMARTPEGRGSPPLRRKGREIAGGRDPRGQGGSFWAEAEAEGPLWALASRMCEEGSDVTPEPIVAPPPPPPPRRTLPDPGDLGPPPEKPDRPPHVNLTPYLPPPLEAEEIPAPPEFWETAETSEGLSEFEDAHSPELHSPQSSEYAWGNEEYSTPNGHHHTTNNKMLPHLRNSALYSNGIACAGGEADGEVAPESGEPVFREIPEVEQSQVLIDSSANSAQVERPISMLQANDDTFDSVGNFYEDVNVSTTKKKDPFDETRRDWVTFPTRVLNPRPSPQTTLQDDTMDFKALRAKFQDEEILLMQQPRAKPVLPDKPRPEHGGQDGGAPRVVFKEDKKESRKPLITPKTKQKADTKSKASKDKDSKSTKGSKEQLGAEDKDKQKSGKDKKGLLQFMAKESTELVPATAPPKSTLKKVFFKKSAKRGGYLPSEVAPAVAPTTNACTPLVPMIPDFNAMSALMPPTFIPHRTSSSPTSASLAVDVPAPCQETETPLEMDAPALPASASPGPLLRSFHPRPAAPCSAPALHPLNWRRSPPRALEPDHDDEEQLPAVVTADEATSASSSPKMERPPWSERRRMNPGKRSSPGTTRILNALEKRPHEAHQSPDHAQPFTPRHPRLPEEFPLPRRTSLICHRSTTRTARRPPSSSKQQQQSTALSTVCQIPLCSAPAPLARGPAGQGAVWLITWEQTGREGVRVMDILLVQQRPQVSLLQRTPSSPEVEEKGKDKVEEEEEEVREEKEGRVEEEEGERVSSSTDEKGKEEEEETKRRAVAAIDANASACRSEHMRLEQRPYNGRG
ncbi:LOW QUALITY PROTEIN: hypothetical protein CRUP_034482 [Coryphaenoides rupestris]|nr:LOW QUALITY PROTEIN: hypothetical protein CRUP_034482 [Coryphaenoides rupestris]